MVYLFCSALAFLLVFIVARTFLPIIRARRAKAYRAKATIGFPCRSCGASGARLYTFHACRCFGIAPFAAVWEKSTREVLACGSCAQAEAISACRDLGKTGGWGFPGVLVVVLYTGANIVELLRNRSAKAGVVLRCIAWGILLPWFMLGAFLIVFTFIVTLIWAMVNNFR